MVDFIIIRFVFGLSVLLFSTHKFVRLAERISSIFRISPLVVGVTVVAIGTSLPELTVSLVSAAQNDTGLAIGNIVGSNIINILFVFPIGLFIGRIRIGKTKTQRNAIYMLAATAAFTVAQFINLDGLTIGVTFLILSVLFSVRQYRLGVYGREHEDQKQFKNYKNESLDLQAFLTGILFIIGIVIGGILVVDSVEMLSTYTGISTTTLGLTLTAVVTSLPELVTTIFSQKDHQEKITIGNVLGSNVYNLLLVGGIIMLFPSSNTVPFKDWLWLIAVSIIFVYVIKHYKGTRPPRSVGVIFLFLLAVYLFTL